MLPPVVGRLVADVDDFIRGWDRAADAAERNAARIRAAGAAAGNGPDADSGRYRDLDAELQRLVRTLRATSDQMREFGNGTRRAGDDVDEFGRRTRGAGNDVDEFGRRIRAAGNGLGGFAARGASTLGILARFPVLLGPAIGIIAAAIAAALALGAGLLGVGVAAGVAVLGGRGLGQAFERLGDTTQGLRRHLDSVFRAQLSEEMAKLGKAVSTLEPEFKGVATAIADVIKGVTEWIRSAEGMQRMRELLGGVRSLVQGLAPGVKALVQFFVEFGAAAAPAMGKIGTAISDVIIKLRDVFREAAKNGDLVKVFNAGAGAIRTFGTVLAWVAGAIIWVTARLAEVSNAIRAAIVIAGAIAQSFSQGFEGMKAAVETNVGAVLTIITELPGLIVQALIDLPARMVKIGKAIIDGLIQGAESNEGGLLSTLARIARAALGLAKGILGIRSPSRVFADEVGRQIPAGIAEGILNGRGLITDALRRTPGMSGVQIAGNTARMVALGQAPRGGGGGGGGSQGITINFGGGTDGAFASSFMKLCRTGQIKITQNAVVRA